MMLSKRFLGRPGPIMILTLTSVVMVATFSAFAAGGADLVLNSEGKVEFEAVGNPSALKIHGKGGAPVGNFKLVADQLTGEATFHLDSLETGMKMRDEHMKKKYLQVEQFPDSRLTLTHLTVPKNCTETATATCTTPFQGQLTLHGVTQPVNGSLVLTRAADTLSVDAHFPVKLTDYKIAIPSFAGITVVENVQIQVQSRSSYTSSKK
ncbi:MAG: YceI family protein [Methylotenera sp.]|nr:YceI family protein [Oligoflexia bacterium]